MLTPAEAEKLILEAMTPFHREDCPLASAHGRILRMDLQADRDLPPFDRVTMDGYALRSAALAAGGRMFRVQGVQAAGMRAFKLGAAAESCLEIMTGAVLPEGADCVVPYEETKREGATMTVTGDAALKAGNAIHARGSDHRTGDVLVRSGTRITGREIAVAAACGYASLTVSQQPKIAVIASGDELVEVDAPVAAHQIRRSNDYAIRAGLQLAGYPNVARFHFRDVRSEIEHLLWHILAEFDVVIVTGGVSKGKFDFLPAELEQQGVQKRFHGVAQRPGKPLWFGVSARRTPVFALPGNPVSAYTCLHRYVLPALAHASGQALVPPRMVALGASVTFKPKLSYLLPVKLGAPIATVGSQSAGKSEGTPDQASGLKTSRSTSDLALPDPSNTSGDFAGLLGTDGFVELLAGGGQFPVGALVPFRPWV